MKAVLSFADADIGYGAKRVVVRANLAVHPGEVVGLVGPNGAGKSTLLRAVTGSAELMGGALVLEGMPIGRLSSRQRATVVGVVPQTTSATFAFPARDFVMMGRHAHLSRLEQPGVSDLDVVERAMRVTDTWRLADTPVDTLSGGDLQRVVLAQALAQEPHVLLLDEPVAHLDLNHRLQVLELVRTLADEGLAVLAVFHDLDLAGRYSDRVAVVAAGRVADARRPEVVITPEMLRDVFGVRAVIGADPVTGSVAVTPVVRSEVMPSHGETRGTVMLIAGAGSGAGLMRRLVLAGFEVTAGALNVGDVDQGVASALGLDHVVLPPYAGMDEVAQRAVARLAASADAILVAGVAFGAANVDNLRVAAAARRPLVLVGEIEGRDFTGGLATRLWEDALGAGARAVSDDEGAISAVAELLVPESLPE